MGKENIGEDRINSEPGAASASPGTDTGTGTTKDTSAAASTGTGAGTGAGTTNKRTRTTKAQKEVNSGLAALEPAQLIEIEIPEPAPEKKTTSSKKKKAAAPNDLEILTINIEMLGAAGFGLVGMLTQQPEIWEITEPELKQIAAPAARIIERTGQLETTNKYSDYIMLFGAVALIVIPRIMAQKALNDQRRTVTDGRKSKTSSEPISEPGPATIPGIDNNAIAALYE